MLKPFVRSREFTQLFLPVIVVAAIGLVIAGVLAFLILQKLTAGETVDHVVAVEGGAAASTEPEVVTQTFGYEEPIQTLGTAPEPKISTPPAPTPAPAPKPAYNPTVAISADGCVVTATGAPGTSLYVSAKNGSKGGETTYTIPASGKLSVTTGGIQGMLVTATILGANGITATATITSEHC